jgi:alkylation response protein AidB-like acyl-CoA dehydrogenase
MTTAAIRRFAVPSPEELIDRARNMVPEIRSLAEETERNRNVLPQIIDKIRDAELLRTCRPKEFGGFEYDGETALRIAITISAACASTGWAVNGAVSNADRSPTSRSRPNARSGAATKTRSPAPALLRPAPPFRPPAAMC